MARMLTTVVSQLLKCNNENFRCTRADIKFVNTINGLGTHDSRLLVVSQLLTVSVTMKIVDVYVTCSMLVSRGG
jgi:hypothetical protein